MADRRLQTALQNILCLPVIRHIVVEDAPARVTLRVIDQHTNTEICWLEFTPDQAETMARYFWAAAICADTSGFHARQITGPAA